MSLTNDAAGEVTPVSGTVTCNIGTTNGLALDTSVSGLSLVQGAATAGQRAILVEGAVTTAAPTYVTANSSPLSLSTAGNLRVDGSGVTQPISGAVSASPTSQTDTFTIAGNGITAGAASVGVKSFALSVAATGAVTSWSVVLEGSLDGINYTTILTHTNTTGSGVTLFSGASFYPCINFRSRCTAIVLGTGTNVVATILGIA
ncbi:MAG: hypothetical protein NVS1B10_06430 [Candidatus Saccharimonadales bacterium]